MIDDSDRFGSVETGVPTSRWLRGICLGLITREQSWHLDLPSSEALLHLGNSTLPWYRFVGAVAKPPLVARIVGNRFVAWRRFGWANPGDGDGFFTGVFGRIVPADVGSSVTIRACPNPLVLFTIWLNLVIAVVAEFSVRNDMDVLWLWRPDRSDTSFRWISLFFGVVFLGTFVWRDLRRGTAVERFRRTTADWRPEPVEIGLQSGASLPTARPQVSLTGRFSVAGWVSSVATWWRGERILCRSPLSSEGCNLLLRRAKYVRLGDRTIDGDVYADWFDGTVSEGRPNIAVPSIGVRARWTPDPTGGIDLTITLRPSGLRRTAMMFQLIFLVMAIAVGLGSALRELASREFPNALVITVPTVLFVVNAVIFLAHARAFPTLRDHFLDLLDADNRVVNAARP